MKIQGICILLISTLLTACGWTPPPFVPSTQAVQPSGTPSILLPTPAVSLPTFTPTLVLTFSQTPELVTPTENPSPTATYTTTPPPPLQAEIVGCNTSIDITHQMGEVTNALSLIKNFSSRDLTNVCATLSAIDEDRQHPDKTVCTELLPSRHQVLFKLTVDTQFQVDTYIRVDVLTSEELSVSVMKESCLDIGLFQGDPADIGIVKPIP